MDDSAYKAIAGLQLTVGKVIVTGIKQTEPAVKNLLILVSITFVSPISPPSWYIAGVEGTDT